MTQAKEMYEKMNTATTEAADLIRNSYSTAVKVCRTTTTRSSNSLARTARRLRLCPEDVRREVVFGVRRTLGRTCTKAGRDADEQTKQLAALAQKVTLATAEPLKTGVAEALNHAA